jgi:hypothetical protein
MAELPLHHDADALDQLRTVAGKLEQLDAGSQRGERISELMAEHCQKLVLAPVRFAQRLFGAFALGDVAEVASDAAVRVGVKTDV